MKRLFLLLLLLAFPLTSLSQTVDPGQTYTARVISVTDGDTFEARTSSGKSFTVRIFGIDAPESDQPYGPAASRIARRLLSRSNVRLLVKDIGPYGRAICRVFLQGSDFGAMLIRRGAAWHYKRYAPNFSVYTRLQSNARQSGRGLWSRPDPVPPWRWRDR